MNETETSNAQEAPERISLKEKVKKIPKPKVKTTVVLTMLLTNVIIVGLLYGKSGTVPTSVVRAEAERIPRLLDILRGFQILANDSGRLGEYVREWSRKNNVTIGVT